MGRKVWKLTEQGKEIRTMQGGMNMKLREYRREDADVISSWVQDEKTLYLWSADRIGVFPLTGEQLQEHYETTAEKIRFYPMTATDDSDRAQGHFFIRVPNEGNPLQVRFGFVIVDPAVRGRGLGREMLRLGIDYAREVLGAEKIDLGVFEANERARHCYESVGFHLTGKSHFCDTPFGQWKCLEMMLP